MTEETGTKDTSMASDSGKKLAEIYGKKENRIDFLLKAHKSEIAKNAIDHVIKHVKRKADPFIEQGFSEKTALNMVAKEYGLYSWDMFCQSLKSKRKIPYINSLGLLRFRPRWGMTFVRHEKIGKGLKEIYVALPGDHNIREKIDFIRSELYEWAIYEYSYDPAFPQETIRKCYYGEEYSSGQPALTKEECVRHVKFTGSIILTLVDAYVYGPPVKAVNTKLREVNEQLRDYYRELVIKESMPE